MHPFVFSTSSMSTCCVADVQEVLGKGDKYAASIAWLPADVDTEQSSMQASNTAANGHAAAATSSSSSSTAQPYVADISSNSSSSSVVIDSAVMQSIAGSSAPAGSGGPGQLPVSSARVASVSAVLPDRFPGPSLSLQDFPQQGEQRG
jgi:hypothetical protein